eukprot:TRINITY_DN10217_c1_g1_i1.p1 TRINITY_DN10217_c1_g1~~TRINITY_DN10217_c1_g1_i1.p1  ORF type:complete len:134 (+),score=13.25 TRINITY_DN10217_c1_g1_i1:441-842(+)
MAHTPFGTIPGKARSGQAWYAHGGREHVTCDFSWIVQHGVHTGGMPHSYPVVTTPVHITPHMTPMVTPMVTPVVSPVHVDVYHPPPHHHHHGHHNIAITAHHGHHGHHGHHHGHGLSHILGGHHHHHHHHHHH